MPHFNATRQFQAAFAAGAGVACDNVAQIHKFRLGGIAPKVEACVVVVVIVGADYPIRAFFAGKIGIHFAREAHAAERAAVCAKLRHDGFGRCHGERRFHARQFFGFDVVEFVVAAQHQQHQFAFALAFHHDGFQGLLNGNV